MRLRDLDTPLARVQAVAAVVLCLALPGGSTLDGSGLFAWNMFSKSETYRITVLATFADGSQQELDPRVVTPLANPELSYFLPAPGVWRHDPVGLTFRTGLAAIAGLVCRVGVGAQRVEVTLEERADLDAPIRATTVRTGCR